MNQKHEKGTQHYPKRSIKRPVMLASELNMDRHFFGSFFPKQYTTITIYVGCTLI